MPRRTDDPQPLGAELGGQPNQVRQKVLTVRAPVRPEKQQHSLPSKLGKRRRLRPQPMAHVESRRRLALETQQVNILLNARSDRSLPVGRQLAAQEGDGLVALAAAGHYLGLHFDRSSERQRQVRLGVKPALFQLLDGQLVSLRRVSVRTVELFYGQRAASKPGDRFDHLWRGAVPRFVLLNQ